MNQPDLVLRFIERCEAGASAEVLQREFRTAMGRLGFRFFACCSHVDPLRPPSYALMVHNYPARWVKIHSEQKLYRIDPVLQEAERRPMPFRWDRVFKRQVLSKAQRSILARGAEYGIAHGYTIPIHLSWAPGLLRASCSVVPDSTTVEPWSYRAAELMAKYLFAGLTRHDSSWPVMPGARLSRRERDCLSLVALGKDDWAIGQLLHVSEATVHEYVERAKRRLTVATRTQAVVEALITGQISVRSARRA